MASKKYFPPSLSSKIDQALTDEIDPLLEGSILTKDPAYRLIELVRKMGARSYLREELYQKTEVLDYEKKSCETRLKKRCSMKVFRFTFFASCTSTGEWHNPDPLPDDHLIGYLTIVRIRAGKKIVAYVFESVVRRPSIFTFDSGTFVIQPVMNYYVHATRNYSLMVGDSKPIRREFKLQGTYFCQQNGISSTCSHAAIRMALNSTEIYGQRLIHNSDVDKAANINHGSLHAGANEAEADEIGMKVGEMQNVLRVLGANAYVQDFIDRPSIDYERSISPYVESGMPVILGIEGRDGSAGHVLTVVGHTFNSDRWYPQASNDFHDNGNPESKILTSSQWCDHFLVNDDNYGPYLALQSDVLRSIVVPSKNPLMHAAMAIALRPSYFMLHGYDAEQIAIRLIKSRLSGLKKIRNKLKPWLQRCMDEPLIFRTFMANAGEYTESLFRHIDLHDSADVAKQSKVRAHIKASLPLRKFWIVEITTPSLFTGQRLRLGEVILDSVALQTNADAADQAALHSLEMHVKLWRLPGIIWALRDGIAKETDMAIPVPMLLSNNDGSSW